MFDMDHVKVFMRAAVEMERHGTIPTDTMIELRDLVCCDECGIEAVKAAVEAAL
jgi:hypothetical protein